MARTQRRFVYPAPPAIAAPEALPDFTRGKTAKQALTVITQLATNLKTKLPGGKPRRAFAD